MMQEQTGFNIQELKFSVLFQYAINEWPASINIQILYLNTDVPSRYSVNGLGIKKDTICEKHLDTEQEILMCNLHEAIFSTIRSLAEFCTQINPNWIRESIVKEKFEVKLRRAIEIPELNASNQDIELVNKYFFFNKK